MATIILTCSPWDKTGQMYVEWSDAEQKLHAVIGRIAHIRYQYNVIYVVNWLAWRPIYRTDSIVCVTHNSHEWKFVADEKKKKEVMRRANVWSCLRMLLWLCVAMLLLPRKIQTNRMLLHFLSLSRPHQPQTEKKTLRNRKFRGRQ